MEKCFKQFTVKRAILLHIQISGNRSSGISVPFDLIQDFQEFSVEKYAFFGNLPIVGRSGTFPRKFYHQLLPRRKLRNLLSEWKVSQLL